MGDQLDVPHFDQRGEPGFFPPKDPNRLLVMMWGWYSGNISTNEIFRGVFHRAVGAIRAKACVMSGQTKLYPTRGQ